MSINRKLGLLFLDISAGGSFRRSGSSIVQELFTFDGGVQFGGFATATGSFTQADIPKYGMSFSSSGSNIHSYLPIDVTATYCMISAVTRLNN